MDPRPALEEKQRVARENGHGEKATQIRDACLRKDLDSLRELSISEGGLVSDELRRQVCSCYPELQHLEDHTDSVT